MSRVWHHRTSPDLAWRRPPVVSTLRIVWTREGGQGALNLAGVHDWCALVGRGAQGLVGLVIEQLFRLQLPARCPEGNGSGG